MSKEVWEALEGDESSLEQDCELLGAGDGAQMSHGDAAKGFHASMSLICPDTGKVTMHTANELRELLQQFRGEQNTPACHGAPASASLAPCEHRSRRRGRRTPWTRRGMARGRRCHARRRSLHPFLLRDGGPLQEDGKRCARRHRQAPLEGVPAGDAIRATGARGEPPRVRRQKRTF